MYGCVVFAINNCTGYANQKLYDHYGNVSTFVVRTCDPSVHPTVVIIYFILGLFKNLSIFSF